MNPEVKRVVVGAVGLFIGMIGFSLSVFSSLLNAVLASTPALPPPIEKPKAAPVVHVARKHGERHLNSSITTIRSTSTSITASSLSDFSSITASIPTEDPQVDNVVTSHLAPTTSASHCQPDHTIDESHCTPKPPTVTPSLSNSTSTLSSANSLTDLPPPTPQCSEQLEEYRSSRFRLSKIKPSWGMKRAKSSPSISVSQPRPPSPPPLPLNCAFFALKGSKTLRKSPSAPGSVRPPLKPPCPAVRSLDKKRSHTLRTQPYQAPYFLPPPGTKAAVVPIRNKMNRRETLPLPPS